MFPWTYSDDETAYILEGEVTVTPDDKSLPPATIKAGDYVKFPKGMSCTCGAADRTALLHCPRAALFFLRVGGR